METITHFVTFVNYIPYSINFNSVSHQIGILLYGIYTEKFHDNYVLSHKLNINIPLYNFN